MISNKSKKGCGTYIQLSKRFPGVPLKMLSECGNETFSGGYILCDKCTLSKSSANSEDQE